jgi:hypothetical protein
MNFEGDAFISYAHLDNVELIEGRQGWVANLHRALEIRVAQLLGKATRIWWDPKLQGNDYFAVTLSDRLRQVVAFVAVVSPRYVKSEWGRKEIDEFCKAAEQQGGVRVRDKARIFKVLKTPVPLDQHPPELQSLLGYEFFKVDPETGRVRELNEIFGPEAQRDFWLKLDDLSHDMCCLLEMLAVDREPEKAPVSAPANDAVYLAVTTADLKDQREAIKRDLEQHGNTVLPDRPLPLVASEVQTAVRDDLSRCRMSIHMVGNTYSLVPEGGADSLIQIQNELAIERAAKSPFSRLVWIPPALQVLDEQQRKLIERLQNDPRTPPGTDLLERPLEDLRTMITARLKKGEKPAPETDPVPPGTAGSAQLYLIYDQRDAESIAPWADFLFKDFEIIQPVFESDEADAREYHEENLRSCDGVLIFYGAGNECWLRRKLREVQKSAGYGRTKPTPVVGISLIAPRTPEKERFRTHEAIVVPQWDGLLPAALQPFVTCLKGGGQPPDGNATGLRV